MKNKKSCKALNNNCVTPHEINSLHIVYDSQNATQQFSFCNRMMTLTSSLTSQTPSFTARVLLINLSTYNDSEHENNFELSTENLF